MKKIVDSEFKVGSRLRVKIPYQNSFVLIRHSTGRLLFSKKYSHRSFCIKLIEKNKFSLLLNNYFFIEHCFTIMYIIIKRFKKIQIILFALFLFVYFIYYFSLLLCRYIYYTYITTGNRLLYYFRSIYIIDSLRLVVDRSNIVVINSGFMYSCRIIEFFLNFQKI